MQTELKLAARETASARNHAAASAATGGLAGKRRGGQEPQSTGVCTGRHCSTDSGEAAGSAPAAGCCRLYEDFEIIARAVEAAQGIVTGAEDDTES